jgi:hypothetical protein
MTLLCAKTTLARSLTGLASALFAAALSTAIIQGQAPVPDAGADDPVEKGVAYLVAEVPRWRAEHPCYSCHNNGDGVRALITAAGRGHDVGTSIDDTLAWLATPERWDANAQRGGSDDLPLGRIQFASTLSQMVAWDRAPLEPLSRAAAMLISDQQPDGSFRPNDTQTIGGPTAYGPALATTLAHRVLAQARIPEAREPAARARNWMRTTPVETVLDASSILIGLERDGDAEAGARREACLVLLKKSQGPDGGWGPYATSQSDVFDTALALMALIMVRNVEQLHDTVYTVRELDAAIAASRRFLTAAQTAEGSWPETTRPANGESYAQRISTTAWALQALMASE